LNNTTYKGETKKDQSSPLEANSHSARQEIHRLCGTRRFIAIFTADPYPEPDESNPQFLTLFI